MGRVQNLNRNLLIATAILLVLSVGSYLNSQHRAERFERGQRLLPNLNPDEIGRVVIRDGEEETVLRRSAEGDRFLLSSAQGYRADNGAVNRFIQEVLGLSLEKKVGSGSDLETELGLHLANSANATEAGSQVEEASSGNSDTVDINFFDTADKEMVRILVGEMSDDGSGSYVRRVGNDEAIYLTDQPVRLSTASATFLDTAIVDVDRSEIRAIRGADFVLAKGGGGELELQDLPEGQKESTKVSQLSSVLSGLRFDTQHLADAPTVRGLSFDSRLEVQLEDDSGYILEVAESKVAEQGEKHFLRIEGFHTAERITIARDASEEEVKETSEVLERVDELEAFNAFHGSWIYEIGESTADRIRLRLADLVEGA